MSTALILVLDSCMIGYFHLADCCLENGHKTCIVDCCLENGQNTCIAVIIIYDDFPRVLSTNIISLDL